MTTNQPITSGVHPSYTTIVDIMRKPSGIIVLIIHSEFKKIGSTLRLVSYSAFVTIILNNYLRVEKKFCYKHFVSLPKFERLTNMLATALG